MQRFPLAVNELAAKRSRPPRVAPFVRGVVFWHASVLA